MILNDRQIKKLVEEEDMINPFVGKAVAQGISHGLNSFGSDFEIFCIFLKTRGLNPCNSPFFLYACFQYFYLRSFSLF